MCDVSVSNSESCNFYYCFLSIILLSILEKIWIYLKLLYRFDICFFSNVLCVVISILRRSVHMGQLNFLFCCFVYIFISLYVLICRNLRYCDIIWCCWPSNATIFTVEMNAIGQAILIAQKNNKHINIYRLTSERRQQIKTTEKMPSKTAYINYLKFNINSSPIHHQFIINSLLIITLFNILDKKL